MSDRNDLNDIDYIPPTYGQVGAGAGEFIPGEAGTDFGGFYAFAVNNGWCSANSNKLIFGNQDFQDGIAYRGSIISNQLNGLGFLLSSQIQILQSCGGYYLDTKKYYKEHFTSFLWYRGTSKKPKLYTAVCINESPTGIKDIPPVMEAEVVTYNAVRAFKGGELDKENWLLVASGSSGGGASGGGGGQLGGDNEVEEGDIELPKDEAGSGVAGTGANAGSKSICLFKIPIVLDDEAPDVASPMVYNKGSNLNVSLEYTATNGKSYYSIVNADISATYEKRIHNGELAYVLNTDVLNQKPAVWIGFNNIFSNSGDTSINWCSMIFKTARLKAPSDDNPDHIAILVVVAPPVGVAPSENYRFSAAGGISFDFSGVPVSNSDYNHLMYWIPNKNGGLYAYDELGSIRPVPYNSKPMLGWVDVTTNNSGLSGYCDLFKYKNGSQTALGVSGYLGSYNTTWGGNRVGAGGRIPVDLTYTVPASISGRFGYQGQAPDQGCLFAFTGLEVSASGCCSKFGLWIEGEAKASRYSGSMDLVAFNIYQPLVSFGGGSGGFCMAGLATKFFMRIF